MQEDLSYQHWVQECIRRDKQIESLNKLNDELMGKNTKLKKEVFNLKEEARNRECEIWEMRKKIKKQEEEINHRNRQGQVIAVLDNGEILFRSKLNNEQNIYDYDKDGRNPEYLKFLDRHNNDATLTYEMVNKLEDEKNYYKKEMDRLLNKVGKLNDFIMNELADE